MESFQLLQGLEHFAGRLACYLEALKELWSGDLEFHCHHYPLPCLVAAEVIFDAGSPDGVKFLYLTAFAVDLAVACVLPQQVPT